nr:hypothetical protein Iba_chr01dCG15500 [Ipomoea batatas]GMC55108.1 hypothetical protein Iba_chr01eCG4320 [Ipomoea batatas]
MLILTVSQTKYAICELLKPGAPFFSLNKPFVKSCLDLLSQSLSKSLGCSRLSTKKHSDLNLSRVNDGVVLRLVHHGLGDNHRLHLLTPIARSLPYKHQQPDDDS